MTTNQFIAHVRSKVKAGGGKVRLCNTRSVKLVGDKDCNGYWDEDARTLVVARKQPEDRFLRLLVHEYCHFRQWSEKRHAYCYLSTNAADEAEYVFLGWLNGTDYPMNRVRRSIALCRDMELDCERLAYETIQELELPMDATNYARRAAAYIHFYNVISKTRRWYNIGKEPYNNETVKDMMPDNLDGAFKSTPKRIVDTMIRECGLGVTE